MRREDDARGQVLARLDSGDASGAVSLARELLSTGEGNADLLGLLGVALEATGNVDDAADVLRRAVSQPATPSIRLRNIANFAALLFDTGKRGEAAALLREPLQWPADVAPGANEQQCMGLLAQMMSLLELNSELVAFLRPVVEHSPHDWPILRRVALALAAIGQPNEALQLVAASTVAAPATERQAVLAHLYQVSNQPAEAALARRTYLAAAPPYLAPGKPEQRFTIGIVSPDPMAEHLIRSDTHLHFDSNFPAQLAKKLESRYRFASLFFGSGPRAVERLKAYEPSLIINNVTNAEVLGSGENLRHATGLMQMLGAPVVNHPKLAAGCTRQLNATQLRHIPNVVLPRVSRFNRDITRLDALVLQIEQSFAYPMIVRSTMEQEASNMVKVDDRLALAEALRLLTHPQVYVIAYAGAPRLSGFHRKIRAAFVEGKPVIMRADYNRHWIVQGRKRKTAQALYRDNPNLLADADDIVRDPLGRLGAPVMASLAAIGKTLPLDVFGIDFDVDDHGRLVFFEANATMNLFSTAPADFAYPATADATLLGWLEKLLQRRATPAVRTAIVRQSMN